MKLVRMNIPQVCQNHPPAGEPNQNQQPQMPYMNAAERIGVQAAFQEVQRAFEQFNGNLAVPYNQPNILKLAIYWALREIDSVQAFGVPLPNIALAENYVRRIATTSFGGCQQPNPNQITFDRQPFEVQMFFMNLTGFLLRFLARQ